MAYGNGDRKSRRELKKAGKHKPAKDIAGCSDMQGIKRCGSKRTKHKSGTPLKSKKFKTRAKFRPKLKRRPTKTPAFTPSPSF